MDKQLQVSTYIHLKFWLSYSYINLEQAYNICNKQTPFMDNEIFLDEKLNTIEKVCSRPLDDHAGPNPPL